MHSKSFKTKLHSLSFSCSLAKCADVFVWYCTGALLHIQHIDISKAHGHSWINRHIMCYRFYIHAVSANAINYHFPLYMQWKFGCCPKHTPYKHHPLRLYKNIDRNYEFSIWDISIRSFHANTVCVIVCGCVCVYVGRIAVKDYLHSYFETFAPMWK